MVADAVGSIVVAAWRVDVCACAATCVLAVWCVLLAVVFVVADVVVVVGSAMRRVLKRSAAADLQPARRLGVAVV